MHEIARHQEYFHAGDEERDRDGEGHALKVDIIHPHCNNGADEEGDKNQDVNLEDSTGRAIWALGEFIVHRKAHNPKNIVRAEKMLNKALIHINEFESPRAIAFAIKGLYNYNLIKKSSDRFMSFDYISKCFFQFNYIKISINLKHHRNMVSTIFRIYLMNQP